MRRSIGTLFCGVIFAFVSSSASAQSISHYVPHRTPGGILISGGIEPMADVPDPPYPPPGGEHAAGDTYTAGGCASGFTESWEFQWQIVSNPVGGGATGQWVLVSYKRFHAQSCEHGNP